MAPEQNAPGFYAPSQTALLLLDYHNYIVNMIQPVEQQDAVVSSVKGLIKAARDSSVPVIHCLIDFKQEPAATSRMKQRWDTTLKPLLSSTPEVADEWRLFVAENASDESIDKDHTVLRFPGCVSAMKSADILELLREKYDVKSLIVSGLITSGAVNLQTIRLVNVLG
ncbi:hypothetical protein HIM_02065 [Hirsutella minnesotensis 3608]|nr:hypothetical protein HIM_02065 [Hirsutella minnesotensis 3608]